MKRRFKKYDPAYELPLLPHESVEPMLEVIDKLTLEQSGEFLSHHGDKHWIP
jgi:hypothetical protein